MWVRALLPPGCCVPEHLSGTSVQEAGERNANADTDHTPSDRVVRQTHHSHHKPVSGM